MLSPITLHSVFVTLYPIKVYIHSHFFLIKPLSVYPRNLQRNLIVCKVCFVCFFFCLFVLFFLILCLFIRGSITVTLVSRSYVIEILIYVVVCMYITWNALDLRDHLFRNFVTKALLHRWFSLRKKKKT